GRSEATYAGLTGPRGEVLRPTRALRVRWSHSLLDLRPEPPPVGHVADRVPEARDLLRRRVRADVGTPRPRRVTRADRVAQKVERLLGYAAQPGLGFVDRQLQLGHHAPHRGHRLRGGAPTADHEVVGVVDDVGLQPAFVPQGLPAADKTAHVHVGQQR